MYMLYIVLIIILVGQEEDEGHTRHNKLQDVNDGVGGVGDQVHAALILHFLMTNCQKPACRKTLEWPRLIL